MSSAEHPKAEPIVVNADHGSLSFQRFSASHAVLDAEYQSSGLRAALEQDGLEHAAQNLCAAEIQHMRQVLCGLGDELASQLSADGKEPIIERQWQNNEERSWRRQAGTFEVAPSATRTHEELNGYEGAADAALVRQSVRLIIHQREENIRGIYQKILASVGEVDGRQDR